METIAKRSSGKSIHTDFEISSNGEESQISTASKPSLGYYARFFTIGVAFGILLIKSEVVSWFRIQEMFRFHIKSIDGESISLPKREFNKGQVFGGLLFGLGWAITGACPGPLFAQIGAGATVVIITLLSAVGGTWVYGSLQKRLPH